MIHEQEQRQLNLRVKSENENISRLLGLAKQSHEQYILKSQAVDLNNAIDYYVRVLKLAPHLSEPYYKLAVLLYTKKEITTEQALKQCKKAVLLDPDCPKAKLFYGYFLNLSGYTKQAQSEFKKVIKSNIFTSSRARIALGLSILKDAKHDGISFPKFTKIAYYMLTGTALGIFDFTAMYMFYKVFLSHISIFYFYVKGFLLKQVRKYDLAAKNYESAARKTPNAEKFYMNAGDSAYKDKDFSHAIHSYKKAIELNPNNTNAILKLTTILQRHCEHKEDELIECYNQLISANSNNARLYYDLGNLYLKIDDKFSALNSFKMALELDNNNPFFMNSYAYVLIQLKHYDEALIYYKKAININPDDKWTSIVCQAQGAIYHQIKGNYDAALTSYEMAVVLDKENYDAYYSMGEIFQDMGDFEEAFTSFNHSLKIKETSKGYRALGTILWEEDKVEESIVAFEKSIAIDENDYDSYNNLGMALFDGIGDIQRALECFKKSVKLNPNDTLAYYNMGRVYQAMQLFNRAAENYQMAIDLNKITHIMDQEDLEEKLRSIFYTN